VLLKTPAAVPAKRVEDLGEELESIARVPMFRFVRPSLAADQLVPPSLVLKIPLVPT
jgi:hypothetical protein